MRPPAWAEATRACRGARTYSGSAPPAASSGANADDGRHRRRRRVTSAPVVGGAAAVHARRAAAIGATLLLHDDKRVVARPGGRHRRRAHRRARSAPEEWLAVLTGCVARSHRHDARRATRRSCCASTRADGRVYLMRSRRRLARPRRRGRRLDRRLRVAGARVPRRDSGPVGAGSIAPRVHRRRGLRVQREPDAATGSVHAGARGRRGDADDPRRVARGWSARASGSGTSNAARRSRFGPRPRST